MSQEVQDWDFEVGEPEHGMRLDEFLSQRVRFRSRSNLRRSIEAGRVSLRPFKDPQKAAIGRIRPGLKLRAGQEVILHVPAPHANAEAGVPESVDVPIVYEDDDLIVVNKPPHMSVYPTRGHLAGSLIQRMHARHGEMRGDPERLPMLCHRLDRETTGLVALAKDRSVRQAVGEQFENREVEKTYLALVSGRMEMDSGTVDAPLGKDGASKIGLKMAVCLDGAPSVTEWSVRERFDRWTLLELHPHTGRQHQLRVHCASIGHPIVGDKLYSGGDEVFLRSLAGELDDDDLRHLELGHHALHAWRFAFRDPRKGEVSHFEAPLWPTVRELIRGSSP